MHRSHCNTQANDDIQMLIQISAGQGSPKECEMACHLFCKELLKEFPYLEIVSENYSDKQCLKSAIFYSEHDLSYLEGTAQWICSSPFRPTHKRKNWFIDVSILREKFRFDRDNDIRYESFRSSGAGYKTRRLPIFD